MSAPQEPPPAAAPEKPLRTLVSMGVLIAAASAAVFGFQSWSEQKLAAELGARVRPGDIRMISSETCVYCSQAREWFTARRVPFEECFVERDKACAAQYKALGARGTPTLLVRGQPQVGFNPQRISAAIASR